MIYFIHVYGERLSRSTRKERKTESQDIRLLLFFFCRVALNTICQNIIVFYKLCQNITVLLIHRLRVREFILVRFLLHSSPRVSTPSHHLTISPSPILFFLYRTCPLHANSWRGKREAHINWSVVKSEKAARVTRTTLRTTGPVPADSRQTENAIGTQMRDLINLGLTLRRMAV